MSIFVGREQLLELGAGFLQGDLDTSVLVLWGAAGSGKSRLSTELRIQNLQECSFLLVDFECLRDYRAIGRGSDVAGLLLDEVASAIATLGVERFRGYRQLRDQLDSATISASLEPVSVEYRAIAGSIRDSETVIDSAAIELLRQPGYDAIRRKALNEFIAALESASMPHCTLILDSFETLSYVDDVEMELADPRPVLAWVVSVLIPRMLRAAPSLRFIVCGQEKVEFPRELNARLERVPFWRRSETQLFLERQAPGIFDADSIHDLCAGNPLMTSLVIESYQDDEGGFRLSPIVQTAQLPPTAAQQWLFESALKRMTPLNRSILVASSIPRTLRQDLIESLLRCYTHHAEIGSLVLPDMWYNELCKRSYVVRTTFSGGLCFAVHPVVRRAVRTFMVSNQNALLVELHRRCADYYDKLELPLESVLHRVGGGDRASLKRWLVSIADTMTSGRAEVALISIEAVRDIEVDLSASEAGRRALAAVARAEPHLQAAVSMWKQGVADYSERKQMLEGVTELALQAGNTLLRLIQYPEVQLALRSSRDVGDELTTGLRNLADDIDMAWRQHVEIRAAVNAQNYDAYSTASREMADICRRSVANCSSLANALRNLAARSRDDSK